MMLTATDRAALTDLVHRYAAGVDDRQFDAVA
ncbi:MAG: nuclear transport factor 2 family protein, partial [Acidimicrobiales bacterium]